MVNSPIVLREEVSRQVRSTLAGAGFLFCIVGIGGVYNFLSRGQNEAVASVAWGIILACVAFLAIPGYFAFQLFAFAFFKPDTIWRIDQESLSCKSRNILGSQEKLWLLTDIKGSRIQRTSKRSNRYNLELIFKAGKSLKLPSFATEAEALSVQHYLEQHSIVKF